MQLNPILALELRARWRTARSYLLLLGVALALSLVVGFIYQRAASASVDSAMMSSRFAPFTRNLQNYLTFNERASAIGRELFGALAQINILVWLGLSAASAATGIARERERGLLESLQLSRMSARAQIGARFGANLLLLAALQLVLAPIYSIAFLMGGVSQTEIVQTFVLVVWSAVLGSALGLWFSARSHRPTNALFGALGVITLLSLVAYFYFYTSFTFGWTFGGAGLALFAHPSALFVALTAPTFKSAVSLQTLFIGVNALWLAVTALLLWSATRNVNRPLPPASWQSGSRWVEKLKQKQAAAPIRSKRSQRASGALLADLPLDRFVRFADPLLAREVKSRFRLRRAGFWIGLVRFALFILAASLWIFEIFWLFDPPSRAQMAPYGLQFLLYGGTLCLGVLSATSWTRERESGTWESLKLSLLTPRQILRAKWLSPLISFVYYSAPLWILLPIGALYVPFGSFLMGALVVAAWWGLAVALGLWVSWRVQNGTASIAWTAGVLATLLIGVPAINALARVDDALAQWKYGVSGWRDSNLFYPGFSGRSAPISDSLKQRYQSETGNQVPPPIPPTGTSFVIPQANNEFERWGNEQIQKAEAFKTKLSFWHPGVALSFLFRNKRSDGNYNYNYNGQDSPPETALNAILLSTLFPATLTIALLVLSRRDLKREQLNA